MTVDLSVECPLTPFIAEIVTCESLWIVHRINLDNYIIIESTPLSFFQGQGHAEARNVRMG